MKLYIISKSPAFPNITEASRFAGGQCVLFTEDGVYCAMALSPARALLEGLQKEGTIAYALKEDLEARGIATDRLLPGITVVDYPGFVGLVEEYEPVPWL